MKTVLISENLRFGIGWGAGVTFGFGPGVGFGFGDKVVTGPSGGLIVDTPESGKYYTLVLSLGFSTYSWIS